MRRAFVIAAVSLFLAVSATVAHAESDTERVGQLQQQARQGDARAQNDLGVFYRDARGGLSRNDAEAARLFKLSADQGNAIAQVNLGALYATGRGVPKDDVEALRLYRLAANKGNARGQNNVGSFYQNGRGGLVKDDREAARYYRLASDQGDVFGQTNLGYLYETGRGVPKNDAEAARLYRLAADRGHPTAQLNLGYFHERGRGGLKEDGVEAVRLFRLAADQGNARALNALGASFESGRGGLPKDLAEAVRYYQLAVEKGDLYAQSNLGTLYMNARGVPKDEREGVRLHRLAADQGHARAQSNMGYSYEVGRGGLPKDDREAVRFYKLAVEQGDVYAQLNLGNFYERGRGGLEADDREAARLYRLAADQGNARGQARLGLFYENGRGGLNKDEREAARFYKLAADQGDATAKSNLEGITRRIPNLLATLPQSAPSPRPRIEEPAPFVSSLPSVPTHASIAAERRVALVIGNSAYQAVPMLPNPANDARQIADALKANGFASVKLVADATRASLIAALSAFQREADRADWAVIYYAGHGMEIGGINYLIPVDARLRDDRDVQDEAVPMNRALDATANAKKLKLVILDACRDNPFLNQMKRVVATRSVTRGLAAIEPLGATLVVYAAKDGETAEDGDGKNSPFTSSLLRRMQEPGVEINRVFRLVTGDVLRATGNRQRPFVYGSLPGEDEYYFRLR